MQVFLACSESIEKSQEDSSPSFIYDHVFLYLTVSV